jgi:acyl carrier protein
MSQDLGQKIIQIVADTQRIPAENITLDSTFQELGIDSLDGVNIVFALENEFDINIPDDDVKEIRSIRDIVDRLGAWLEKHRSIAGKPAGASGSAS